MKISQLYFNASQYKSSTAKTKSKLFVVCMSSVLGDLKCNLCCVLSCGCSKGWPQTGNHPASASQVLGQQTCISMTGF